MHRDGDAAGGRSIYDCRGMRRPRRFASFWAVAACLVAAPVGVALALALGPNPVRLAATALLHAREADYAGAAACGTCHMDHLKSWRRTHHSTMTQLPSASTVLGNFDEKPVAAFGASATPFERNGRFYMSLPAIGVEAAREAEVALCVGSRRYQQYFEAVGDGYGVTYRRLPLLWHVAERRWLHLNGVFLEPDNDDWNAHRAAWNDNCIFCHNTGVVPGLLAPASNRESRGRGRFDSHVSDLGIACEACHGAGLEHARRNASLLERYRAALGRAVPDDIVDPKDLDQARSSALCAQCHSQRLPDPPEKIWQYLDVGPSFRPGDVLSGHVVPLNRETPSPDPSRPNAFRERFWNDGTPRLTAYEYQGLVQSPCFRGGKIHCGTCHTMHSGDVEGQLEPEMRGDRACTQCHAEVARDVSAHTHHMVESSGSRCLECHMPRMVYGVLDIHRSHRIESPDVRRDVEASRPNACTACHYDRTALWAAERMRELWGARYEAPRQRLDGAPLDVPEALASLHAGDPVRRAVYVTALGLRDAAVANPLRGFAMAHALVGLGDPYGAVRLLARRSSLELDQTLGLGLGEALTAFDVQAAPERRVEQMRVLFELFERNAGARLDAPVRGVLVDGDYRLDRARVSALLRLQVHQAISIGE
jgi:predicted CXXCH cytochrome family protein